MMIQLLINGAASDDAHPTIAAGDRGLHYGDGVFETLLLKDGCVRLLAEHWQRLRQVCERLSLPCPELALVRDEIQRLSGRTREGVVKVILTRGVGGRGYAPPLTATVTRLVALYPPPDARRWEVSARWCEVRLGRNPHLAGIKHLNRLEQVLAQMQIVADGSDEGLMLDSEGDLVGAISSNVFLVRAGGLITPDLSYCGVNGVMRAQVMRVARQLGFAVLVSALRPDDLLAADEVFLTNAVRGLRPLVALGASRWNVGPVTLQLHARLELEQQRTDSR